MATTAPTKKLVKAPGKPAAKAETTAPTTTTAVKPKLPTKSAPKVEAADTASADDMIVKTANEVENLKSDKAFDMVPKLLSGIDHDNFRLGGYLSKIHSEGWFMEKGYENFKAYVLAEAGIEYRKAMYLIGIYNGLVESGVPWEKVKHLGWTKLKELAPILTKENVDDWVAVAETMTTLQLQEHIKASTKGAAEGDSPEVEDTGAKKITTKTFKLHEDQKKTLDEALAKAKHQSGTESDAVAIEYIAMDYLAGGKGKAGKPQTLKQVMEGKSPEEVIAAIEQAFPAMVLQATMYDSPEEAQAAIAEMNAAAEAEEGEEATAGA